MHTYLRSQYSALTPQIVKNDKYFHFVYSCLLIYIFIYFIFDIVDEVCAYMYKMMFGIVANGFVCASCARDECRYFHKSICLHHHITSSRGPLPIFGGQH